MITRIAGIGLFLSFVVFRTAFGSGDEYRLLADLRNNYDAAERPVYNHSLPVNVKLRILLQQLVDVDEKNQVLTLVTWMQYTWHDYKMIWDPKEYGNITSVQMPNSALWHPDILLFNRNLKSSISKSRCEENVDLHIGYPIIRCLAFMIADEHFDASFPVNFVVNSDGSVLLAPPAIVRISCSLSMTWFPYDDQLCYMKFGSWTYTGSKLNLEIEDTDLTEKNKIDLSYYVPNGEFDLLATPAQRIATPFKGDQYVELYFYMHLKRKTLYYGLNWIVPTVLISLSNIVGFTMPPECGEKITLQITNLLSVTVFLGMVSDVTPPTSESIPVIAAFLSINLVILGTSIIFTLVVVNVHFRNAKTHVMGAWTRAVFLDWLPWLLLMRRPGYKFSSSSCKSSNSSGNSQSKSSNRHSVTSFHETDETVILSGKKPLEKKVRIQEIERLQSDNKLTLMEEMLVEILEILKAFKNLRDEEEEEEDQQSDWRFCAMVIDRFSLFLFTFLIFSFSAVVFFATPNILDAQPVIE